MYLSHTCTIHDCMYIIVHEHLGMIYIQKTCNPLCISSVNMYIQQTKHPFCQQNTSNSKCINEIHDHHRHDHDHDHDHDHRHHHSSWIIMFIQSSSFKLPFSATQNKSLQLSRGYRPLPTAGPDVVIQVLEALQSRLKGTLWATFFKHVLQTARFCLS